MTDEPHEHTWRPSGLFVIRAWNSGRSGEELLRAGIVPDDSSDYTVLELDVCEECHLLHAELPPLKPE